MIQTTALEELFPNWKDNPPEPITPAKTDRMRFLTKKMAIPIPPPPQMHNKGNYIISLNNLCKWLAEKAEELGVEVYPGFGASEVHPVQPLLSFSLYLGVGSGIADDRYCIPATEP